MTVTALVSVICPDRIGLISSITGYLFDSGVNLGDTTFAVLGGGAEFTAVCELPEDMSLEEIETDLKGLEELENADVTVQRFDMSPVHSEQGRITHRIALRGGDRPGILARLSELFIQNNSNIVRLNSEHIPGERDDIYEVRIAVWIPENKVKSCLASVANTAGELHLSCKWSAVES